MARRGLFVALVVATLLVPSAAAAGEPTTVKTLQRRDTFVVAGTECGVLSRQVHYDDGTVDLTTIGVEGEPGSGELCFHGVQEARVRYSFVDADGDAQSGEAAAPRAIRVTVHLGDGTDLQSFHGLDYGSGRRTPDYRLPK